MLKIYEILVPTAYGDTRKPISTRHHKNWDKFVRKITGGLTILSIARGQWIHHDTAELFEERVIPVRIACKEKDMQKIVEFSLCHYRQFAIFYYKISDEVIIYKKP
jgi:hypothetical protein